MKNPSEKTVRQQWMEVLARSSPDFLEKSFEALSHPPDYLFLRRPETGLVMVRGRMDGEGDPFNLGEVAVTRCTVKSRAGYLGVACVRGTEKRHAELAACFDALLQDNRFYEEVMESVVKPSKERLLKEEVEARQKAEATRVDFFTMVRGE